MLHPMGNLHDTPLLFIRISTPGPMTDLESSISTRFDLFFHPDDEKPLLNTHNDEDLEC